MIVLYGMGGIGKTQITLEYVHTHHADYSSVFWVNATSEETTTVGFRSIAQRLVDHHAAVATAKPDYPRIAQLLSMTGIVDQDGQLSAEKEDTKRMVEAVKRWYSLEKNQNWLLVLDNVDDLESFDIRTFIPTSSHGMILMTSRRRESTRFGTGLEVEEMLELEGTTLLLKSAGLYGNQSGAEPEGKSSPQYLSRKFLANRLSYRWNDSYRDSKKTWVSSPCNRSGRGLCRSPPNATPNVHESLRKTLWENFQGATRKSSMELPRSNSVYHMGNIVPSNKG